MKKLYLVRHAKSSWKYRELRDFERPLKKRGIKDAELISEHLSGKISCPDYWISSPAKRAWETAKIFAKNLKCTEDHIKEQPGIYASSVNEMLTLILSFPDDADEVMLFGHEPTLSYFCEYLSTRTFDKVPTSGVVAFTFDIQNWNQIKANSAHLDFFIYPKMFRA